MSYYAFETMLMIAAGIATLAGIRALGIDLGDWGNIATAVAVAVGTLFAINRIFPRERHTGGS